MLPLKGLLVLDLSQFLAGPAAALRLADLGARVIKVERPQGGDFCRQLYISNLGLDGDSTLFHTINRNKESFTANLKDKSDLEKVRRLVSKADVLIQSFRPGIMERLGLDYGSVRQINPRIVYGSVSGYGEEGPWRDKPGQDLLAQALSGALWLSGNGDDPPTPMGLSVADVLSGALLAQGILACLVRRGMSGEGGLVQVSLLETMLDFQFEVLTTYLNDGGKLPQRSKINNGHAYVAAPYGVYATADDYLALAMTSIPRLGELIGLPELSQYDPQSCFDRRDEIKAQIASHLKNKSTRHWLDILEPADVWCAEVLDWPHLLTHEAFKVLNMIQKVSRPNGAGMMTTRCPIRIDSEILTNPTGAPTLGADTQAITSELSL